MDEPLVQQRHSGAWRPAAWRPSGTEAQAPLIKLSEDQIRWICARIQCRTDPEAAEILERQSRGKAARWLKMAQGWESDDAYKETLAYCETDPKGAFLTLSMALLPKALIAIMDLMDSARESTRLQAVQALLKVNGLFIDKTEVRETEEWKILVADLNKPVLLPAAARGRAFIDHSDEMRD